MEDLWNLFKDFASYCGRNGEVLAKELHNLILEKLLAALLGTD